MFLLKNNNCKSKSFSPIVSVNHFNISIEIKIIIIILKTKYQLLIKLKKKFNSVFFFISLRYIKFFNEKKLIFSVILIINEL